MINLCLIYVYYSYIQYDVYYLSYECWMLFLILCVYMCVRTYTYNITNFMYMKFLIWNFNLKRKVYITIISFKFDIKSLFFLENSGNSSNNYLIH